MAETAKYPTEIPTTSHLPTNRTPSTQTAGNHSVDHNRVAAELLAIARELGTNPKGAFSTVRARLDKLATDVSNAATATHTHSEYLATSLRGAPTGVAPLDSSALVPLANLPSALESSPGAIQIASQVEVDAETSDEKAVTPLKLATYVSGEIAAIGAGSSLAYQGTWDATSGAPSATPSTNQYWVVSVAGTTSLSGITDWQVGDWALYNGTAWQKVDQTFASTFTLSELDGYDAAAVGNVPQKNGVGGLDWVAVGASAFITVSASRALQASDNGNILYVADGVTLTLTAPDTLADAFEVAVYKVGTGTVDFAVSGTATLTPSGTTLTNATATGLAVSTLTHRTAGEWLQAAGDQLERARAHRVIEAVSNRQLVEDDDGATIELADNVTASFADNLSDGWSVHIVRIGATAATISRGTGHVLNGPTGDAASYAIDTQGAGAFVYCKGGNVFRVVGPVT